MSEALDYLLKARPEAMGHYFSFLKDAGKHLDPKTRALISVITKVHAQTERGLRQYLKRALRDGCSAAELIDALLMAFPALGLAKIIWAVDVILAMKLPEFEESALKTLAAPAASAQDAARGGESESPQGRSGRWHDVMAIDALRPATVVRVDCDGRGLFVADTPSGVRVHDSRCPHRGATLSEAELEGTQLTCPGHGWVFDAASGDCLAHGDKGLDRLESRVDAGRVMVFW